MTAITRDQHFPRGLTIRKLTTNKRQIYRLGMPAFVAVYSLVLPAISISNGGGVGGAVAIVGAILFAISTGDIIHTIRSLWQGERQVECGGLARHRPTTFVAEIDHAPDATTAWDREFVSVGADSYDDALAAVCDEHGVSTTQIVHLRELDFDYYQLGHFQCSEQYTTPWIDTRDDPVKAYVVPQITLGLSYYSPAPTDDQTDIVCHSLHGVCEASYVKLGERTISEQIAMHEIHELVHWACQHGTGDDWGDGVDIDESAWDDVLWDVIDHVQAEQPDGPWYLNEVKSRIDGTRGYSVPDSAPDHTTTAVDDSVADSSEIVARAR